MSQSCASLAQSSFLAAQKHSYSVRPADQTSDYVNAPIAAEIIKTWANGQNTLEEKKQSGEKAYQNKLKNDNITKYGQATANFETKCTK